MFVGTVKFERISFHSFRYDQDAIIILHFAHFFKTGNLICDRVSHFSLLLKNFFVSQIKRVITNISFLTTGQYWMIRIDLILLRKSFIIFFNVYHHSRIYIFFIRTSHYESPGLYVIDQKFLRKLEKDFEPFTVKDLFSKYT